jgi:hypothetical protein
MPSYNFFLPERRVCVVRGAIEQTEDLLGGAGFAQLGKYSRDAVVVRVSVDGGHGVDGEGNVKSQLVRLAGGRLDTEAGGDAGDNDGVTPSLFR